MKIKLKFEFWNIRRYVVGTEKIKRRPEIIRALSDYIIGMLDQPETMEAPITLFELDKMIPKKANGDYLKYMKLSLLKEINW